MERSAGNRSNSLANLSGGGGRREKHKTRIIRPGSRELKTRRMEEHAWSPPETCVLPAGLVGVLVFAEGLQRRVDLLPQRLHLARVGQTFGVCGETRGHVTQSYV